MDRPPHSRALLLVCGVVACAGGCSDDLGDPLIEALLPAQGAPGALVDVVGERLTVTRGTVHFGGRPAKVLIWTPQRARVQVPDVGLFGWTLVVLTAEGRPSNAVAFYVEGDPRPDTGLPDVGLIPDLSIPDLPRVDGVLGDAALDAGGDMGGDAASDLTPDAATPDAAAPDAAAPDAAPDAAAPPDAGGEI